jgi:DNA mismatch endonuclease (patch repair protein)
MMAGIKGKNTKPELLIRKAIHALGYRYRLHPKELPGKPDIFLRKYNAAIFVNGCFWHGHDCHLFRLPGTRTDFWAKKISDNTDRDERTRKELAACGIRHMTVWECALKGRTSLPLETVIDTIDQWLQSSITDSTIKGMQ